MKYLKETKKFFTKYCSKPKRIRHPEEAIKKKSEISLQAWISLLNKQGIAPVLPLLKSIDDINIKKDWFILATEQGKGNGLLFYVYATQDDKNSAKMVLATWGGRKSLT